MSLAYLIETGQALVVTRGWGVPTDRDLEAHQRRLAADPVFDPAMRQIALLQEVQQMAVSAEGVRRFAALDPFTDAARRAIVVRPGQPLTYGLMRMFSYLATDAPEAVQVQFDHVAKAEGWLGLSSYALPATAEPAGRMISGGC